MKEQYMENILEENKKLKEENRILKEKLKKMESNIKISPEDYYEKNLLTSGQYNFKDRKFDSKKIIKTDKKHENIKEMEDMSIISFLARSNKRVQILKSLSQGDKIPSFISKEIDDSSHHVSKYLTSLKEKGLIICLNEEDKRFRFYRITAKGKYYLEIFENKKF